RGAGRGGKVGHARRRHVVGGGAARVVGQRGRVAGGVEGARREVVGGRAGVTGGGEGQGRGRVGGAGHRQVGDRGGRHAGRGRAGRGRHRRGVASLVAGGQREAGPGLGGQPGDVE